MALTLSSSSSSKPPSKVLTYSTLNPSTFPSFIASFAFIVFVVGGRMISGVHWISDIVGGALLSAGLVATYYAFSEKIKKK